MFFLTKEYSVDSQNDETTNQDENDPDISNPLSYLLDILRLIEQGTFLHKTEPFADEVDSTHKIIRSKSLRCTSCTYPLNQIWKYCAHCGLKNPYFSSKAFISYWGYNEQIFGIQECVNMLHAHMYTLWESTGKVIYCYHCGIHLFGG